ncbi:MAG: ATP-binding cassette domain-containing protein [Syntrophomonadaceae bacterium]|jgi:energy-coupling factor transport system ATP-binding protein|nr:ATP-binding cassette domain-containing protein [Syntrophomonadaceae bacterium]
MPDTESILRLNDVYHTYSYGTPWAKAALDGVSFQLRPEETVIVTGSNGSGKSTLLQHMNGLLKPERGQIYFKGQDIWQDKKNIRQVRFQIGIAFQFPEYQLFHKTVAEDIAFGPKNMGLTASQINERTEEALFFVGLEQKIKDYSPQRLSTGEKRRVSLAGIIAMQPKILLLDEPTVGLDPQGGQLIMERMRAYQQARGIALVIVTHDLENVGAVTDRVIMMKEGKIHREGQLSKILAGAPDDELPKPVITQLFQELSARGVPVNRGTMLVNEAAAQILDLYNKRKEKRA